MMFFHSMKNLPTECDNSTSILLDMNLNQSLKHNGLYVI